MLRLMTRENKLALVVGFGLILLVGILISDHFSTARNQEAAELTQAVDQTDSGRWEDPDLIALRSGQSEAPTSPQAGGQHRTWREPEPGNGVRAVDPISERPGATIEMGRQVPRGVGADRDQAETTTYRFHDVRRGESLTSICRHYYGDISLLAELARFNSIDNTDALPIGRRLRIPEAGDLVRGRQAEPQQSDQASLPPRSPNNYTVQEGDNLSTIAQRMLGSSRRYLAIYELNRDVLDSPDDLKPGMVLRIPSRSD